MNQNKLLKKENKDNFGTNPNPIYISNHEKNKNIFKNKYYKIASKKSRNVINNSFAKEKENHFNINYFNDNEIIDNILLKTYENTSEKTAVPRFRVRLS